MSEDNGNRNGSNSPPLLSHAFDRFIKDYESGFKSVQDIDVGKFRGFSCVQALGEVKKTDSISPKGIGVGLTDHFQDIESLEDEFINLLLQHCPVEKNKHLFWRRRPELNRQESDGRKNFRIYARLKTQRSENKRADG